MKEENISFNKKEIENLLSYLNVEFSITKEEDKTKIEYSFLGTKIGDIKSFILEQVEAMQMANKIIREQNAQLAQQLAKKEATIEKLIDKICE